MSEENNNGQAIGSDLLAEMTKDYTPEMMATLDDETRASVEEAKASKVDEPKPESDQENQEAQKADVSGTTETVEEPKQPEDLRKVLSDELVKANARYSSLKGKYDAEGKRKDARIAELEAEIKAFKDNEAKDNTDSDDFDDLFADDNDKEKNQDGEEKDEQPKAEEVNDVQDIKSRLEAVEAYQLNRDLDQSLRRTVGIGIADFDAQPLRLKAMNELTDENGVTAETAIEQAKARHDNRAITSIVRQVVNYMQEAGQWQDDTGNFPTAADWKARNSSATLSANNAAINARQGNTQAAVVPHATGPAGAASPVPRTREVIERELDTYIDRMSRGDFRAASKVEKLQKELLEATR